MLLATHSAIGALLASYTASPVYAFIIGFISHLLTDMIPHGDTNMYRQYKNKIRVKRALLKVSIDALISIILIVSIFAYFPFAPSPILAWGIIGAILPDLLVGFYEVYQHPALKLFHRLHFFFHDYFVDKKRDITLKRGIMFQIIFLIIVLSKLK